MKKILLLTSACCLLATATQAQLPGFIDPVKEVVVVDLPPVFGILAGFGPNVAQRMVNGNWRNKDSTNGHIDSRGNQTIFTQHKWDTVNNLWLAAEFKIEQAFTYDGSNRVSTMLRQISQGNQLAQKSSATFSYDGSGKRLPTVSVDTAWQGSTPQPFSGKDSFVYNGSGKIVERIGSIKIGSTTMNNEKYTYTWNGGGQLQSSLRQAFSGGNWTDKDRQTNVFDGSGNLIISLKERYNSGSSSWDKDVMDSFSYSGNKPVTYTQFEWKNGVMRKEEDQNYIYTGNLITEGFFRKGDSTGANWVNENHAFFYYSNNAPTHAYGYRWTGSAYETNYSERIFWGNMPVGLHQEASEKNGLAVYPNPSKGMLNVNLQSNAKSTTYLILDIAGREVLKGTGDLNEGNLQINATVLKAGMYYLTISGKTSRIVIE